MFDKQMVDVKLFLRDTNEVLMFAQLTQALEQKRLNERTKAEHEMYGTTAPSPQAVTPEEAATLAPAEPEPEPAVPTPGEKSAEPVEVDDVTLMRAVTEYATAHGVAAARLKLEAFNAVNAMSVPKERRAEFVRSLA